MHRYLAIALLPAFCLLQTAAIADETNITIYSNGFGLVSETRAMELEKGLQDLHFEGVSSLIEPSSVLFQADGVALLEQNYEYDLVDGNALLRRYLAARPLTTDHDAEFTRGLDVLIAGIEAGAIPPV